MEINYKSAIPFFTFILQHFKLYIFLIIVIYIYIFFYILNLMNKHHYVIIWNYIFLKWLQSNAC